MVIPGALWLQGWRAGGLRVRGGLAFRRAATKRWAIGWGRAGGCLVWFRLGCRRFGVEHERFLVLWVMRVFVGWWIIGVRTGIWIPYRSRVGASRLSQASGLLVPLAGSETTRPLSGRCSARGSHGMPHVLSGPAPRPRPARRTDPERGREIARKGSPQPAAVPRTRHTQTEQTHAGRTHRERPLTAVSSTESAVGKWQYSARSTQYAASEGGDTAHAHARNDTHPAWPHPVDDCTGLDARRTRPTGTPRPGQCSRSGSGSGSILDAGRPGPPHRQHPAMPLTLPLPLSL